MTSRLPGLRFSSRRRFLQQTLSGVAGWTLWHGWPSRHRALAQQGTPTGQMTWAMQCRSLWERAQAVLAAGGTALAHTVRCDQFLPDWRAMPFFHAVRREVCGTHIPPSTSVLEAGLLLPEAAVTMHLVAVAPSGPALLPLFPPGLALPATSSFVPVIKAGGFVLVTGLLAAHGAGDLGGIAPEAQVPEGHLGTGQRIQ